VTLAGAVSTGMALVLAAVTATVQAQLIDYSSEERARIGAHGPWPPPPAQDPSNALQRKPAVVALGKQLFGDARLSADGQLSCAGCHVPAMAFQDGRPLPLGRSRHTVGARNTPSLLDTAWQRWLGWGGANDSLWAASLAPLLASNEMAHASVASVAATVRRTVAWREGWQRAFGKLSADDELVAVQAAKALAAYQASLVSARTPFDDFRDALLRGDSAAASRYPLAAQRGLRLFMGSARCNVCHVGAAFSNGEFADIGRPFFVPGGVDSGRHGGLESLLASRWNRLGPFNDAGAADPRAVTTRHVVQEHRHFGEFRVPTLRQLHCTGPYMHDGSLPSLRAVVQHYSQLDEERLHADGERILRRLDLSDGEAADLQAFLGTLSSSCVAAMPSRLEAGRKRPRPAP
jgi:cytochrome c peroxidase